MKFQPTQPYQPLLLRILHGIMALCAVLAIITAYWTYNTYDGRWGTIPLPKFEEIEGIHGTFGLWTLLIFPLFILYAFHRGQKRLIQANSLSQINKIGQPIGWYHLHRIINTLAIFALSFALFSGKMMSEDWLPKGELDHFWYNAHLMSWLLLIIVIFLHFLMGIKIGGFPLIVSMFNRKYRAKDNPMLWKDHLTNFKNHWQTVLKREWLKLPLIFKILEIMVLGMITLAWMLSLFKEF